MTDLVLNGQNLNVDELRTSIRQEYAAVADDPQRGFHFHTGRKLARLLGYRDEWVDALPAGAVESMAGTGNPFSLGEVRPGERVVDAGSGAGADSLI
ncbi:MAG: methyltransferase domain-containing protein, partial [Anaerolineales bacterium]